MKMLSQIVDLKKIKVVNKNIDNLLCINSTYKGIEAMPEQFVDHFTPKDPGSGKSLCELN